MREKVYCENCRHYDTGSEPPYYAWWNCRAEKVKSKGTAEKAPTEHWADPQIKNKKNNCKDYDEISSPLPFYNDRRFWYATVVVGIVVGIMLLLAAAAQGKDFEGSMYVSGKYSGFDVSSFEKNEYGSWQYTNDHAYVGFGVLQDIGRQHHANLEIQLMSDMQDNYLSGMRFALKIGNAGLDLEYTYRHYFDHPVNAEYSLGQASIQTLTLNLHASFWSW